MGVLKGAGILSLKSSVMPINLNADEGWIYGCVMWKKLKVFWGGVDVTTRWVSIVGWRKMQLRDDFLWSKWRNITMKVIWGIETCCVWELSEMLFCGIG